MPHDRNLSPPAGKDGRAGGAEPVIHEELRRHYDALYDQLLDGRSAREARPALDVGTGDGLTLSAIVQGTPLSGVAIDTDEPGQWFGPLGWSVMRADAQRLPFADAAFRSALMVDVFEWLRHPAATLAEIARVTDGPILIVQTDWEGLWVQSDRSRGAETGRDLIRAYTRGAPSNLRSLLKETAAEAQLDVVSISAVTIKATRLELGALAWDLLESIRRYLVIESAQLRARRFDDWRSELQRAAEEGQFEMLLRREIALLR